MVVLLVIMGMTAVWMTASLPAWKHNATREKEAELVFRGQQYVRALSLYQRKMGPGAAPLSFDQLYDAKLLRKKYKDPITNDDFLPLYQGGSQPGQQQGQVQQPGAPAPPSGAGQGGTLVGVQSKSTATSIMVYNGATHYNEWQFIRVAQQPGRQGGPGGPGGPGGQNPRGGPGGGLGVQGPGGGPRGVGPGGGGRGPGGQPGSGRGPGAPAGGPGRGRGL